MSLKKEKDPTSKQFDDDEWILSLTETQEVATDVPEDRVEYDQQEVDPEKKSGPSRWESSCESTSRDGFWRPVMEKCSLDDFHAADRSGYPKRR